MLLKHEELRRGSLREPRPVGPGNWVWVRRWLIEDRWSIARIMERRQRRRRLRISYKDCIRAHLFVFSCALALAGVASSAGSAETTELASADR